MHKITKGLKKKKKGKKSKHKEDDLFKPEELEAYRREHQQQAEAEESGASGGQNEEWKKFLALTSEVDDILKKTQGDLDRIKSTSFFQRVPPPSEAKRQEEEEGENEPPEDPEVERARAVEKEKRESAELGIVQVSESEEESEEEDDIFDTAYIDAIAAGEVKLAYIPESPTEQADGDDPFDTSIAERAILGPAVERKGKKLVPIGAAVEVLTGRVQAPTCATKRPVSHRRQVLKEKDLLLASFDDNANSIPTDVINQSAEAAPKTLLDDEAPPLDEPIDLSKTLYIPPVQSARQEPPAPQPDDILSEFDVINNQEEDDEFAQLAVESLNKPVKAVDLLPSSAVQIKAEENWQAFPDEKRETESSEPGIDDADPFDTTFAENILPGKAELKVIENEVLHQNNDFEFDPRADERISKILSKVTINVVDEPNNKVTENSSDRIPESELNLIKPIHRDLLGGSNTDLSNLNDQPLKPSEKVDDNYIEYCDPFDTSIVEIAKLPGQTELKFIEKELLGDLQQARKSSFSDDDFDPRAEEPKPKERTLSRPDVLNLTPVKSVSFDLPSPTQNNLLTSALEPTLKKPVTPFYVRKSSIPEEPLPEELTDDDPFDTSFVTDAAPGKAELKIIESELLNPETDRNLSLSDQDFDPRNENIVKIAQVKQTIKEITDPQFAKQQEAQERNVQTIDLLAVDNDIAAKVLTPAATVEEEISYVDPFDTSIASNILPGKTELKLLETELIHSTTIKRDLSDPDFNPRAFGETADKVDLLEHSEDSVIDKPLSPVRGQSVSSFDIDNTDEIDPFDTSIANNIGPGKTELKLIESELM